LSSLPSALNDQASDPRRRRAAAVAALIVQIDLVFSSGRLGGHSFGGFGFYQGSGAYAGQNGLFLTSDT
jgi:hypothetical protein